MALLMGIIGMLGAPCCLIWLIVSAIRSGSKKTPLIGILVSCMLFFSGVMMFEPDDEPVEKYTTKQSDSAKDAQSNDTPVSAAEDKMEIIPVKTDTEKPEPEKTSNSRQAGSAPDGKASTAKSGESKPAAQPSDSKKETNSASSSGSNGGSSNFYTYDNDEQQKTEDSWVLNTSSMKIHYPTCSEVKKIASKNYSTSNLSESELISNGYTTCGRCH